MMMFAFLRFRYLGGNHPSNNVRKVFQYCIDYCASTACTMWWIVWWASTTEQHGFVLYRSSKELRYPNSKIHIVNSTSKTQRFCKKNVSEKQFHVNWLRWTGLVSKMTHILITMIIVQRDSAVWLSTWEWGSLTFMGHVHDMIGILFHSEVENSFVILYHTVLCQIWSIFWETISECVNCPSDIQWQSFRIQEKTLLLDSSDRMDDGILDPDVK